MDNCYSFVVSGENDVNLKLLIYIINIFKFIGLENIERRICKDSKAIFESF